MLSDKDILDCIDKNNLSVRRIPNRIVNLWTFTKRYEGDVFVFRNNREFREEVKIPERGGWYMVQEVNDTNSMVRWNYKRDNLAPTLSESIELYLKNKEKSI